MHVECLPLLTVVSRLQLFFKKVFTFLFFPPSILHFVVLIKILFPHFSICKSKEAKNNVVKKKQKSSQFLILNNHLYITEGVHLQACM